MISGTDSSKIVMRYFNGSKSIEENIHKSGAAGFFKPDPCGDHAKQPTFFNSHLKEHFDSIEILQRIRDWVQRDIGIHAIDLHYFDTEMQETGASHCGENCTRSSISRHIFNS